MSSPHQIALIGFEPFEYTTFESFFNLATRRDPGYAVSSDLTQADLLIINAENTGLLLSTLKARSAQQRVLLVGRSERPEARGLPLQIRPVRFMSLLSTVDKLLSSPVDASLTPSSSDAAPDRPNFEATQPISLADLQAARRPTFAATEPFAPLAPMGAPERPVFAATQPFAPLDAGDSATSTGFAATQPFEASSAPGAPAVAPVVIPKVAYREELITAESLAAYRRARDPVQPTADAFTAAAPAAEQTSPGIQAKAGHTATTATTAPTAAQLQAALYPPAPAPISDFQASSTFLGIASPAAPILPAQVIDDVLVVDDSDVALKFVQNRLGRLGFRVTLARSGEEALDILPSRNFRFVILDVMMGKMDGFQACRLIKKRAQAEGKQILVFMLSGRGGVIDKMRGSLAGADAYLTKPLNESELRKLLAKYEVLSDGAFAATRVVNPVGVRPPTERRRPGP